MSIRLPEFKRGDLLLLSSSRGHKQYDRTEAIVVDVCPLHTEKWDRLPVDFELSYFEKEFLVTIPLLMSSKEIPIDIEKERRTSYRSQRRKVLGLTQWTRYAIVTNKSDDRQLCHGVLYKGDPSPTTWSFKGALGDVTHVSVLHMGNISSFEIEEILTWGHREVVNIGQELYDRKE